ncbi:cytochrome P450 [Natronococcus sp. A-GB1]|uniref:cytochrome P450 n=1 Tax=Natronococcus sp. A-GB1 TaxID=3037648 RepID=UPI002420129D|nr:cytochrome P450 [Natronococcus sp. A-GB1]MDG5760035.1 cytochrome P450 [Natronococcus sp. A-GB1]
MSSADPQGLQAFPDELSSREAWLEPFDWYREMRENAPVRYDPSRGCWDVFRYADVKRILDDDGTFSVNPRLADDFQEPERPEEGLLFETMLFKDPPRHDELRGVVDDAFEPRAIRALEPEIRELATDLLSDALADDRGELDIVDDFAYPLPVVVIAQLLGVPAEDREQFKRWSDTLVESSSTDDETEAFTQRQREAQMEMASYFFEMIADRRESPRDDLMSQIVTRELEDGSRLSEEEALGTCILLLIAGNITTTNLVTNAVRCFDAHDLFDELRAEPDAIGRAIEEVLRYRSPVQAMSRVATEDVTLRDTEIESGDRVVVWLGSANRDERQFEDADAFVPNRSPNQHLGFGHGTHYCLGAPLARLEASVALEELCARTATIETVDTDLQPVRSSLIYGVESLPIRYERSSAN